MANVASAKVPKATVVPNETQPASIIADEVLMATDQPPQQATRPGDTSKKNLQQSPKPIASTHSCLLGDPSRCHRKRKPRQPRCLPSILHHQPSQILHQRYINPSDDTRAASPIAALWPITNNPHDPNRKRMSRAKR
ncbi:telomerase activating protein Est1 [Striga asiatica]|uniref:Telomerase activating protein Est1 n=1 Tax=Striga asiatica TaxID=4170 RepID=A0A5A7PPW4_STRAF|nr:telomerase activating protein Est1 [Striga asiatica]